MFIPKPKLYCVLVGNPVDGVTCYGPFDDYELDQFTANFDAEYWVTRLFRSFEERDNA